MVNKRLVEVATTEVAVPGRRLDVQLALPELHDGAGVVAVSNIDEHHPPWLLLRGGEIKLGDAVAEGNGGRIVDESQRLQAGDLRGVEQGSPLDIGEPGGHADDHVGDRKLHLLLGDGLDLAQVHGHKLRRGELFLLAQVGDLDTHLAVDIAQGGRGELLLDLDIGIIEGAAQEALQVADGVLEVGDLLRLGGLSKISALGAETDEGPGSKVSWDPPTRN